MNKITILGTGMVGSAIGTKMIQLGYQVKMGREQLRNEKALAWVTANGDKASQELFRMRLLTEK